VPLAPCAPCALVSLVPTLPLCPLCPLGPSCLLKHIVRLCPLCPLCPLCTLCPLCPLCSVCPLFPFCPLCPLCPLQRVEGFSKIPAGPPRHSPLPSCAPCALVPLCPLCPLSLFLPLCPLCTLQRVGVSANPREPPRHSPPPLRGLWVCMVHHLAPCAHFCPCRSVGGFSKYPGGHPDILHSFYGVCGLQLGRPPWAKAYLWTPGDMCCCCKGRVSKCGGLVRYMIHLKRYIHLLFIHRGYTKALGVCCKLQCNECHLKIVRNYRERELASCYVLKFFWTSFIAAKQ